MNGPRPGSIPRDSDRAYRLLERWQRAVGGSEALVRRLTWDDLTPEGVGGVLAASLGTTAPRNAPGMEWMEQLEALVASVANPPAGVSPAVANLELEGQLPFFEIWARVATLAIEHLRENCGASWSLLAPGAVEDLARHIVLQVSDLCSPAAFEQFSERRESAPKGSHAAFMDDQLRRGLLPLFEEYPALARQLCRVLDTWIASTAEMLERAHADGELLAAEFAGGRDPGMVRHVEAGLSDRHAGGRRVAVLEFESGLRVVYKPRPLDAEAALPQVLAWLGAHGLDPLPRAARALARGEYGWMEHVRPGEPGDRESLDRWFRRAGALLCVTYLLGATDLHMDNVVATGEGPVVVDLETALQPALRHPAAGPGVTLNDDPIRSALQHSFLATGLLSFRQERPGSTPVEIGGILGRGGYPLATGRRRWTGVGTDRLDLEEETVLAPRGANVLCVDGEPVDPSGHVEALRDGFEAAYRIFMRYRDELLEGGGFVPAMEGLSTRVVFRPSHLYVLVLRRMLQPRYQKDPLAASLLLESLNRPLLRLTGPPPAWPLVSSERRALEGLDLPRFTVPVDAEAIPDGEGRPLDGTLDLSGIEAFHHRLVTLGDRDLDRQIRILEMVLEPPGHVVPEGDPTSAMDSPAPSPGMSPTVLLEVARSIGSRLEELAVVGKDGALTWLEPGRVWETGGIPYALYDGACGPALLFASLARVTGEDRWEELAHRSLRFVEPLLEEPRYRSFLENETIGICSGLGGLVHTLGLAGHLLGEPALVGKASRVARLLEPGRIREDRRLDVVAGSAGALLALAGLHELTGEEWLLDRAGICAEHLVDRQVPSSDGAGGWPTIHDRPVAGFAHGASGIVTALARLHRRRPDHRLLEAIRKGLSFERTVFDPESRNWPLIVDTRAGGSPRRIVMTAWCHGAPGIALARLELMDAEPDELVAWELEVALETTLGTPSTGPHHLCCGTLGRTEILLETGLTRHRPKLIAAAEAMMGGVMRQYLERGRFALGRGNRALSEPPGFFQGLSGIGYACLRVAAPGELPLVLSFRPPAREAAA